MSRWGERETRIFVKLYLSHGCLWDKNHALYRSRFHKDKAMKDIIEKFAVLANISLDTGALRYKIKNLKSTYCQELKNIRDRSTPKYPYRPTLKWFYDFHKCFGAGKLKEEIEKQLEADHEDSSDNVAQEVWLDQSSSLEPCKADSQANSSGQDPFPPEDYILLLKEEPAEQNLETETIKFHSTSRKPKRKLKKRHSSSEEDYTPKHRRKTKDERYQSDASAEYLSLAKEDEFDIYGKFIASQLRGMGLQKALRVQLKIQNIVSEARMATSGDEA